MTIRTPNKVRQQRRIILLALYLLKRIYCAERPSKKQVLNFVSLKRLMHIPQTIATSAQPAMRFGRMIWHGGVQI
jgi:hypothetical protein